jgi:hypothetical protein
MRALQKRIAPALAPLVVVLISASAASAASTYYAVGKPVCKPAKAHQSTCFAVKRVMVKKGTKGAKAFKLAAGATGAATQGLAGGLTPSDLATAYGLTTTGGSGQTVAIVDAYNDPNINADLGTFDTQYGLAACTTASGCLRVVNQTGGTTLPANDTTGWSVEESLDVEAVHSVCQGCHIILIEANSPSNSDLGTAENTAVTLGANEVTNSFGGPENGSDSTFQAAFDHPDTVITASTGDDGYYSFDCILSSTCSPASMPNIPSSYNTVVSVGGTSLYLGQDAHRQSESVWNDNGPNDYWEQNFFQPLGATGGGCSLMFSAKGWQSHEPGYSAAACANKRLNADVSAVGDYLTGFDVYDSYIAGGGGGWETIGGTSLSSPVIAAVYGLAGGSHGVPFPAVTLYGHPGKAYDVTSGGNGYCGGEGAAQCPNPNSAGQVLDCAYTAGGAIASGNGACDAAPGFDGPSGLGTPNGLTMFQKTAPKAAVGGPTTIAHATQGTWNAAGFTDPFPGGAFLKYIWQWGDGTPNTTTTSASANHTYATAGAKTITLTVEDNYDVKGLTTYPVTVS